MRHHDGVGGDYQGGLALAFVVDLGLVHGERFRGGGLQDVFEWREGGLGDIFGVRGGDDLGMGESDLERHISEGIE